MPKPSPAVQEIRLSQRLGDAVRKARQELGLSQPDLAKRTGLSKSYLSYLESGKYEEIGIGKFVLLLDALDLSADDLLTRAGIRNHRDPPTQKGTRLLATHFGLEEDQLKSALDFLTYLRKKQPTTRSPK